MNLVVDLPKTSEKVQFVVVQHLDMYVSVRVTVVCFPFVTLRYFV